MVCSDTQCFVPEKTLKIIYTIGVGLLALLVVVDLFTQKIEPGVYVLAFIYALLGGLMVFKKISIVCCPAKILLVGVMYISIMTILNIWFF